jgi:hypothetical protein
MVFWGCDSCHSIGRGSLESCQRTRLDSARSLFDLAQDFLMGLKSGEYRAANNKARLRFVQ